MKLRAARREESKRLIGDLSCPLRTEQARWGGSRRMSKPGRKDPEGVLADLTAAGEQWSAGAPAA
jgi:hypothetical protein